MSGPTNNQRTARVVDVDVRYVSGPHRLVTGEVAEKGCGPRTQGLLLKLAMDVEGKQSNQDNY